MNKLVKASIAGAAGFALLLGGAGTFALWNTESTSFNGVAIQSGSLQVQLGGNATAKYTLTNKPVTRVVPGDEVSIIQPVTITAIGDTMLVNLQFSADLGPTSPGASQAERWIDPATVTYTARDVNGHVVPYVGITAAQATAIKSVVAAFKFPSAMGNDTQNNAFHVERVSFNIQQVGA